MAIPKVSSTEFQQNVGRYQDMAQRTPVAITKNGREHTIMMSAALFEVITKGRIARKIEDADDETLDEISRAEVAPEHAHRDSLLKDWDAVTLPKPEIGLIVHYSCLWANEHAGGAEEGIKNRPCAIVAATRSIEGKTVVTVFPITHAPPSDPRDAVELPAALKRHLGLDDERSWVVVTEFNRFVWPGVDLQPRPGATPRRYDYGVIPGKFMARVIEVFDAARRARRVALLFEQTDIPSVVGIGALASNRSPAIAAHF